VTAYQFLASNAPLKEVKNEKVEIISAKEAIKRKIEINLDWLNSEDLESDEKIILIAQSEDDLDEIEITVDVDGNFLNYTKKLYTASLSWHYSENRALELINYIKEHLNEVTEIELWEIWADEITEPLIKRCSLSSLSTKDIEDIFGQEGFEVPKCLIVEK